MYITVYQEDNETDWNVELGFAHHSLIVEGLTREAANAYKMLLENAKVITAYSRGMDRYVK